ncbi:uncharacterized protein TM35_000651180 [Trypanosoma theileri]|uniref:Uncharacterized protein n=1 Tax=Trypanosoma theileri TaxID=67003 RepID=A0A1X0NFR3_9TRYP|nr:uncharacterized protein TM35_000651180 [Trypanosoma theileri]ORC83556.1 hypothetical protein TM35_000651180 [Trypanosoma theileri]
MRVWWALPYDKGKFRYGDDKAFRYCHVWCEKEIHGKCRKRKISTIGTFRLIGILVCWHPTATMGEVCLVSLEGWKCVSWTPRLDKPSLPKASRGWHQRSTAPTPRWWQKKKLRRVRHPGFQYHH